MQVAPDPWSPPGAEKRGRARDGMWQWLVPACCALASLAQLGFAQVQMFSFEPTHDALFTAYVYEPLAHRAGQALALSAVATAIAVALRPWRSRSVVLFGAGVLCTLSLLGVGALMIDGYRSTEHRKHPEARMLAALRAVPVSPGWRVLSPPALESTEDLPLGELQAPEAHATFTPGTADRASACAELASLLLGAGWDRIPDSCWFRQESNGVRVTATVSDDPSAPLSVTFDADPVTS